MVETFQDRLNQALEIRDMKPVELSQKTGLSKARISQYTNGVYEAKQKCNFLKQSKLLMGRKLLNYLNSLLNLMKQAKIKQLTL